MLIVCQNCATSYMIEAASLGAGGRTVRCARCKATWFARGEPEEVSSFADDAIAEAEADSPEPFLRAPAGPSTPAPTVHFGDQPPADNVGESPPAAAGAPDDWSAQAAVEDAPSLVPPMEQAPADAAADRRDPSHAGDLAHDGDAAHGGDPAHGGDAAADRDSAHDRDAATDRDSGHDRDAADHNSAHDRESDSDDVETFVARRQRLKSRRKQAKRSSRWTAAILVLFALNVALISGRSEVVRYMPQTASLFAAIGLPVNLQQLRFENVRISPNGTSGEGLLVAGTIVSVADKPIKVPLLRFAARNAAGQEIYTWTAAPKRQMLDPGDRLDFRSELAAPPPGAKDVLVRFLTADETADLATTGMKPSQMRHTP